jgi:predicted RNase H-like HicB family nuclease
VLKGWQNHIRLDNSLRLLRDINYWSKKIYKYATEIFYSEEDEGYIAVVPELPGCSASGEAEEVGLKEVMTAMELWLETAEQERREIPKPAGKEPLKAVVDEKTPFLF